MQSLARRVPATAVPAAPQGHDLVEGFVTASLLYCVGAMAVIGSIQDAAGQPDVLFVKALLDGVTSVVLASTLGAGVALSVLPLAAYQGGITAAASGVAAYLTVPVLATLTSAGGLLIAAIGLDLSGIEEAARGQPLARRLRRRSPRLPRPLKAAQRVTVKAFGRTAEPTCRSHTGSLTLPPLLSLTFAVILVPSWA